MVTKNETDDRQFEQHTLGEKDIAELRAQTNMMFDVLTTLGYCTRPLFEAKKSIDTILEKLNLHFQK